MRALDVRALVLAKAPVAGLVKTRLCPPYTAAQAATLAAAALADTLRAVARSAASHRVLVLDGRPDVVAAAGFDVIPQRGRRPRRANRRSIRQPPCVAAAAASRRDGHSPAHCRPARRRDGVRCSTAPPTPSSAQPCDGGYWAVGLRCSQRRRFPRRPDVSTVDVPRPTRAVRPLGLRVVTLPTLRDVDDAIRCARGSRPRTVDRVCLLHCAKLTTRWLPCASRHRGADGFVARERVRHADAHRCPRHAGDRTARARRRRAHRHGLATLVFTPRRRRPQRADARYTARRSTSGAVRAGSPSRSPRTVTRCSESMSPQHAVSLTRAAGGVALHRSVFTHIPGEGRWDTVLLIDGNIGIGGDPIALLRRVRQLLAPTGCALIEARTTSDGRAYRSGPNPLRRRGRHVVVSMGSRPGRHDRWHRGRGRLRDPRVLGRQRAVVRRARTGGAAMNLRMLTKPLPTPPAVLASGPATSRILPEPIAVDRVDRADRNTTRRLPTCRVRHRVSRATWPSTHNGVCRFRPDRWRCTASLKGCTSRSVSPAFLCCC